MSVTNNAFPLSPMRQMIVMTAGAVLGWFGLFGFLGAYFYLLTMLPLNVAGPIAGRSRRIAQRDGLPARAVPLRRLAACLAMGVLGTGYVVGSGFHVIVTVSTAEAWFAGGAGVILGLSTTRLTFKPILRELGAQRRASIANPPLMRSARLLEWVLPQRVYERCVGPLLGDHQAEYFEALSRGQVRRARWLVVVCYLSLASQLAQLGLRGLARMLCPRRGI